MIADIAYHIGLIILLLIIWTDLRYEIKKK